MAMTYASLTASKGTSGAIATWVNYSKLDIPVIVDEAQTLLYSEGRLRVREMMSSMDFTMPLNSAYYALPNGLPTTLAFLEPIGPIQTSSFNSRIRHKDPAWIQANRNYTETTGSLGTNPFTTVSGSNTVSVALTNHGFTQDSVFNVSGATAFNGVTINGTFPISGITDANDFTIDITSLNTTPTGSGAGGGSSITYLCDSLTPGTPYYFSVWSDTSGNPFLKFEQAFFQTTVCRLSYYYHPPLLSSSNTSNFLCTRYPKLLRIACMAAAAEFMKDDDEYQKWLTRLQSSVEAISVQDDMANRGLELDPEIP